MVSEARHLGRKVAATNSSSRTSKAGAEPDKVVVVLKAHEQARIEIAIGDKARNAGVCKSQSAGSFSVISISPNPSPPVPAEFGPPGWSPRLSISIQAIGMMSYQVVSNAVANMEILHWNGLSDETQKPARKPWTNAPTAS